MSLCCPLTWYLGLRKGLTYSEGRLGTQLSLWASGYPSTPNTWALCSARLLPTKPPFHYWCEGAVEGKHEGQVEQPDHPCAPPPSPTPETPGVQSSSVRATQGSGLRAEMQSLGNGPLRGIFVSKVGKATSTVYCRKQMCESNEFVLGITLGPTIILTRSQYTDLRNGLQKLTLVPHPFEGDFTRHVCCEFEHFTKRTGLIWLIFHSSANSLFSPLASSCLPSSASLGLVLALPSDSLTSLPSSFLKKEMAFYHFSSK